MGTIARTDRALRCRQQRLSVAVVSLHALGCMVSLGYVYWPSSGGNLTVRTIGGLDDKPSPPVPP